MAVYVPDSWRGVFLNNEEVYAMMSQKEETFNFADYILEDEFAWSKDGLVKHGYIAFHGDGSCELRDLFGVIHTDFEDLTDYCSWVLTINP